jgi:hypothetical protein
LTYTLLMERRAQRALSRIAGRDRDRIAMRSVAWPMNPDRMESRSSAVGMPGEFASLIIASSTRSTMTGL